MWQFILTDRSHVPQGELLNAYDRQIAVPLNKLDTLSCKVRLDNPLVDTLASCEGYIKAFRDGDEMFHGPIISAEENGDANGASVAINAVGAGWILSKRLAGKSSTGQAFSLTDRAAIIESLIDTANAENETGIATDGPASAASAVSYTAGPYRPINEIITELSASFDGFDWRILPLDNWVNNAVADAKIGRFYAAPTIGVPREHAVFEWGTGTRANMVGYKRAVTRDTQANKVYHHTSNGPDAAGYPTISAIDPASITDWKLLEDLAQADLLDSALRAALVTEHVRVRKHPRQTIEFSPSVDPQVTGRLPRYGDDYVVGDSVRARAAYGSSTRFDAMMRVWGVTFALDANGTERATLALAEES